MSGPGDTQAGDGVAGRRREAGMPPGNHLELPHGAGRAGEAAAADILKRRGHRITRANYRVADGEIDIISETGGQIVFTEVKTRRSTAFGSPLESVTPAKQRRLVLAAQAYLSEVGIEGADWRIDLVAIVMDRSGKVVRSDVIENALAEQPLEYYPGGR